MHDERAPRAVIREPNESENGTRMKFAIWRADREEAAFPGLLEQRHVSANPVPYKPQTLIER